MANAVWLDLVNAVQAAVQGLGLTYGGNTPLPAAQVIARKFPTDRGVTSLPLVVVAPGPVDRYDEGDFEDTVVYYPVYVVTEFATNQAVTINGDELRWRQQILDVAVEFEATIRTNVPTADVSACEVDMEPAIDMTMFRANTDVGGMLLTFRTARARARK